MAEERICPHCNVSFSEEDWPAEKSCPVCGKGGFEEEDHLDQVFSGASRILSGIMSVLLLAIKLGLIIVVCYFLFSLYRCSRRFETSPEEGKPAGQSLNVPRPNGPPIVERAVLV